MRDLNTRWDSKNSEEERKEKRCVINSLSASLVTGIPSSSRGTATCPLPPRRLFFSSIPSTSFPTFTCHESGPHERGLFSTRRVQQTPVTIVPLRREAYNYNILSNARSLTISTRWPILVECVNRLNILDVRDIPLVIGEWSVLNLCHGERDKLIQLAFRKKSFESL